jgi:hypothetical protein
MNTKKIQPRHAKDVTPEVIAAWKEAHPRGIWKMDVNDEDYDDNKPVMPKGLNGDEAEKATEKFEAELKAYDAEKIKTGYVRKPSREELACFMTAKDENPLDIAEGILRDCWLGGDEELLDDFDWFQGAVMQFQELMKVRTGQIKKL